MGRDCRGLHSQALAPLAPAAGENGATAGRAHAATEPVLIPSLSVAWLEGPLHETLRLVPCRME